jgi:hypothetical protein
MVMRFEGILLSARRGLCSFGLAGSQDAHIRREDFPSED